jgi:hypothetical protein
MVTALDDLRGLYITKLHPVIPYVLENCRRSGIIELTQPGRAIVNKPVINIIRKQEGFSRATLTAISSSSWNAPCRGIVRLLMRIALFFRYDL